MPVWSRAWIAVTLAAACAAQAPPADDAFAATVAELGAEAYPQREAATRQLLQRGPQIEPQLRAAHAESRDPEIRRRLAYILANLHPPEGGVLIVSTAQPCSLEPGDIVTHANARPVTSPAELGELLGAGTYGAVLRVRRGTDTLEVGPVRRDQLAATQWYQPPRGPELASILRSYHAGQASEAARRLLALDAQLPLADEHLVSAVRGAIAFSGGYATEALRWLEGDEGFVRPLADRDPWSSPSQLDWMLGHKAPFQLEWELFSRGGDGLLRHEADYDLRMQRVLVPAGRYGDTLVRAAKIWTDEFEPGGRNDMPGNMLAVVGWMFHELELRSECCRLIEPRSVLLRQVFGGPGKWVRVDTEAWLPYFAGREAAALDVFYDHAYSVLASPAASGADVIRNPDIAARVAFFAYQVGDEQRLDELAEAMAFDANPALRSYAWWMLYGLSDSNADRIHADLLSFLPRSGDAAAFDLARWAAILEHCRPRPQPDVLATARRLIFERAPRAERDRWLAIADAIAALARNEPGVAVAALIPFEGDGAADPLLHTARFRADPPPAARRHASLADVILATPLGADGDDWLLIGRGGRLLALRADGSLAALPPPTPSWQPNPLCWPLVGSEPGTGRAWVYDRRRVVEYDRNGPTETRLNIRAEQIADFDTLVRPVFSILAEAAAGARADAARDAARAGDFLAEDVRAHGELAVDPALPEVGVIQVVPDEPRLRFLALRGGPYLLVDPQRRRAWSDRELAGKLGLEGPLPFVARGATYGRDRETPIAWLFTQRGLLRFSGDGELEAVPLSGDAPFPPVIPERLPFERSDPGVIHVARLPEDGGAVYRVDVNALSSTRIDLTNLALPPEYYPMRTRAAIRSEINARLEELGIAGIRGLIADAVDATGAPRAEVAP